MKKSIIFLVLLCTTITLNAQTRLIAVKGKNTDTVVKTFSNALKVAKEGDVIYLPGGSYVLGEIKKKVHILGAGYNDTIPRATLPTTILGNLVIAKEANGTIIEGLTVPENVYCKASEVIFRRCKMNKTMYFEPSTSKNCQIINCIVDSVSDSSRNVQAYNSVFNQFYANYSEINNCIVYTFWGSNVSSSESTAHGVIYGQYTSRVDFTQSYKLPSLGNSSLAKVFKNKPDTRVLNLANNYQLNDSIAKAHPQLGIYKGQYPWKDGGQPITPHIEENNSYLDVQSQTFKLRVKVRAQSK